MVILRRLFLVALLIATVLVAREYAGSAQAAGPPATTRLCGQLTSDTTWTVANSPYQLDCNVGVVSGATLTIQPGVVVYGTRGAALQVQGMLDAVGTSSQPIAFQKAPGAWGWSGIQFIGGDPDSHLSHASISDADIGVQDYPGRALSYLAFTSDIKAISLLTVSRDRQMLPLTLDHITIGDVATGLQFGYGVSVTVTNSTITWSGFGVDLRDLEDGNFNMQSSTIAGNGVGVAASGNTYLAGDNIFGSARYNVVTTAGQTVRAANNWWGTTDAAAIQSSLGDCHQDLRFACVNFQPYLSAPSPEAPQAPSSIGQVTVIPNRRPGSFDFVATQFVPNTGIEWVITHGNPAQTDGSSPGTTDTTGGAEYTWTTTPNAPPQQYTVSVYQGLPAGDGATAIGDTSPVARATFTVGMATPTPTPASPTPGLTPTPVSTTPGLSFMVKSAKVEYRSSTPQGAAQHTSLAQLKAGQTVKLYVFAMFTGVTQKTQVQVGFRITRGRTTVYFAKPSVSIAPASDGSLVPFSTFWAAKQPGNYTFSGTVFVAGKHQHKSIGFAVTRH